MFICFTVVVVFIGVGVFQISVGVSLICVGVGVFQICVGVFQRLGVFKILGDLRGHRPLLDHPGLPLLDRPSARRSGTVSSKSR